MSQQSEGLAPQPAPDDPTIRRQRGRAARGVQPRAAFGTWEPAPDRRDPLDILRGQSATRVPDLVPIRFGRMAASPFAFYRGAAAVMAADLGTAVTSGLTVQLCGDAHLANFGGFASPERSLVFDINDFDETHPGPFEWDVQRFVASLEVAARYRKFGRRDRDSVVSTGARVYRETMRMFAGSSNLDIWYAHLDVEALLQRWGGEVGTEVVQGLRRTIKRAESKDRLKARSRLTKVVDGELRFKSDPPLLVPVGDVFGGEERAAIEEMVRAAIDRYRTTLSDDRQVLLGRYRFVDLARKVVGVGSVGTRSWVALLVGRDDDDPLFLQVKEAEASVLEPYASPSRYPEHGQRVVEGQRLLQASSDVLLGWQSVDGIDGRVHQYYVRQLWDWKASADLDTMTPEIMRVYAQMCGWTLARGHARSGDAIAIGGYLGKGTEFDRAMAAFAQRYADQNTLDHQSLVDAIAAGDIEAQADI